MHNMQRLFKKLHFVWNCEDTESRTASVQAVACRNAITAATACAYFHRFYYKLNFQAYDPFVGRVSHHFD